MNVFCLARLGAVSVALTILLLDLEVALAQQEKPAATIQYAAAAKLQNIKSYDLATDAWLKFLKEFKSDPRVDQAHYNLGVCYYQQKNLDLALATFETVIEHFPQSEKLEAAYLYLGATQHAIAQSGKTEMCGPAIDTFNALIEKYANGKFVPNALFFRGECFYMQGKKQEAIQSYGRLVQDHPQHELAPDALYASGACQEELKQHQQAGIIYETFLKSYPTHSLVAEVTMRRGETLFTAGEFAEAAKRFASAAATPGFQLADQAAMRQADCLSQAGRYAEAASLYQAIPAKFPQSKQAGAAIVSGGKCYYRAGNYAEARKVLAGAIAAGGPSAYEAVHWIAKSWLQEKQPEEAVKAVEKALPQAEADKDAFLPQLLMDRADAVHEIPQRSKESIALYAALAADHGDTPIGPRALYMAGFAALESGVTALALKHADAFLAKYGSHELAADVLHVKSESHLLLNQLSEAESLNKQLLDEYPDHPDSDLWKVRRGLLLQLRGKHQETIQVLQPLLRGTQRPDLVAEAGYLIGTSQMELGQHEAAIASLEAAMAGQAKWRLADETLLTLARAYGKSNDFEKANATIAKLVSEFPQSKVLDKAYYRLGECSYLAGDFQAAATAYRKVIDSWPQSPLVPHALHELGCALMDLKDNAAAEQAFDRLLESHSGHKLAATARFSRGMARHRMQSFTPAMEDLRAFLAGDPAGAEKSDARYLLGLCMMGLDQHGPAAAAFEALLKEDPEYANADDAIYQRAWALKLSGNDLEAARTFQDLVTRFPTSRRTPEAYFHIGELKYGKKEYDLAALAYYKAMTSAGKSELAEKAAHKLAWSYYHQGAFENAQKTLSYQLKTYPQGAAAPDATFMEAECFFKQDKFQEALAAYGRVKNLTNEDFQTLVLLHAGQAAGQLKQWERSLEFLDKCTEQFPESPYLPEALYERGWAHQNLGNVDESLKLYVQVIDATDAQVAARAQFMIGEIQFGRKEHEEAIRSYFKVMYGYSYPIWQAEATFEAALCFELLEKKDQATKLYQELIDKFPQSERLPAAKGKIEQLRR